MAALSSLWSKESCCEGIPFGIRGYKFGGYLIIGGFGFGGRGGCGYYSILRD